jgi:DNA-binding transcriptional MerR regulator
MADGKYQSKHVATLFDLNPATLRKWCLEFAAYLSPTASPGEGRHRLYTNDDLAVISLVKQMKSEGALYEDIHVALAAGERGALPDLPSHDLIDVAASESGLALLNQFRQLSDRVERLEKQITHQQSDENERLRRELRDAYIEIGQLRAQLKASDK